MRCPITTLQFVPVAAASPAWGRRPADSGLPPASGSQGGWDPAEGLLQLSVRLSQGVAFALLGALQQNGVGGAQSRVCVLKPGAHPVHPTPGPSSLLTTQHPVLMGSKWGVGENPGPITVPSPTPSRSSVIDSPAATLPVCTLALHCRPACRFCTASSAHKH